MAYDIERVEKVLGQIGNHDDGIVFTEHFLEKIGHRRIPEKVLEDKLLQSWPVDIRKVPKHSSRFELQYVWGEERDLIIFIDLLPPHSIILASSFVLLKGVKCENN
jgi:hypothetical protein